jgi:PAS domain S-box-containing protein
VTNLARTYSESLGRRVLVRRLRRRFRSLIIIIVVFCVLLPSLLGAPVKEVRRVLLLYSMGPSSPTIALIDRQIRALLEESPFQIEFYTEYMDTNLFPDEASQREFRDWYIHKYRNRQPDVVVALAAAPIRFMIESHAKFFPKTPIVFCCASEEQVDTRKLDSQFTGVWMRLDPAKTLDAALRLQPSTKHLVIVGGAAASDQDLTNVVRQSLRPYEGKLDFIYLTELAMPVLLERLKHLPEESVVLYTNIQQDAVGTHFMSATQALPMVTGAANAPVFVMADTLVDQGAVGGYVTSFAAQGQIVSTITTRILKGERAADIPVVQDANAHIYDWRALDRWGFKDSDIPPGSVVLNRQLSAWQAYRLYIISGISLCAAEGLLIFGLLWHRAKRKRVEQSLVYRLEFESLLSDLSTTFINLPEEQVSVQIKKGLGRIGKFLQMERITIHEFSRDRSELLVTSSWHSDSVPPEPGAVKTSQFPWWMPRLMRGEVVLSSEFKGADHAPSERTYLREPKPMSLAVVPLQVGGEINGAVSFASTKQSVSWNEDLTNQLKVIADIFSNALKRKHTEGVLRESEERFRLVANTAPVMIWMSGPEKYFSYFNNPWLNFTGRTLSCELGNGWADGVHIEDLHACLETFDQAFDQRRSFQMEFRLRRHDGEYRWIADIGIPKFDTDGSFAGYIGSAIDVTERRLAEEALSAISRRLIDAQEKERTRIARELHDDINQRLALLAIELGQLAQGSSTSPEKVGVRAHELSQVVSEIGTDIQAISHQLHSSKLEYLGIVAAAKSFCRELSEQQKIEVDFTHRDVPRDVSADVSLCLFRVLQEALHNAVKHSGVRRFEVQLAGAQGVIELTVRDSGVGFDNEAVLNNPGLGLISMRERVSLVSGYYSIVSEPMRGTKVSVRVPIVEPTGPSSMALPSNPLRKPYERSTDLAS